MLSQLRDGIISELNSSVDVPLSSGIDITVLTAGDENPMFVTLPVIKVGLSRNKRYYSQEILREIDDQIKATRPGGILGHIGDQERGTRFDIPKVIWVGSLLQGDTLFAKGYIPQSATDLREYLTVAKATGHRVSTSIYGQWPQQFDATNQQHIVGPGGTLESIDFAPPARAGMDLQAEVMLTSEMQSNTPKTTVKELSEAGQRRLSTAIMDAMGDEVDGAEPGTYIVVRASGTTRIPTPNDDNGLIDTVASDGKVEPQVQVSIESSRENFSGPGGGTMERNELIKTLTLAEMADFPQHIKDAITAQVNVGKDAGKVDGRNEILQPLAELVGVDKGANQPTLIAAISEMRNELSQVRQREAQRAVDEKVDSLLVEGVKGEGTGVATARSMVRRLVTSEMKINTVEEAERAVAAILSDAPVQTMIGSLVAAPVTAPTTPVTTPTTVPVSEMASTSIRPMINNQTGGANTQKSAFNRVPVQ